MLNAHNVLQRGAQSYGFGTPNATATAQLQSVSSFSLTPDLQTRQLDQLRGTLAPTHQTVIDQYMSNATFEVSDETYEDLNYWLDSLFSEATPAGAYTRAYAAPLTGEVEPTFMTLQWGQTAGVYQMQDASLTTLTMSGSNNTGIQVGGSLIGGQVKVGTLAVLSDREDLQRISGCGAQLFIDAWDGTVGSTELEDAAFSWELTVNANRQYRGYLGDCTPTAWHDNKWTGQLRVSVELKTATAAYLSAMLASGGSAILEKQIKIAYAYSTTHELNIEFAGHSLQAPQLFQDRNGVTSFDLVFDGVYNPTFANWLKIDTKSAIAALV